MSARLLSLLIAMAAALAPTAWAASEAGPRPTEPAAAASAPADCPRMARHDHGADRGMPMAMPDRCATAPAAPTDEPAARPRARKLGHDHARTHKLM